MRNHLTLLNIGNPKITADFESSAPTGISIDDIKSMEQFLVGLHTHTGQVVTPEKARRCSAVLACIRILCEDISALPLCLYKRTPQGDEPAINHNLYTLLDVSPNDIMTSMEVREHIILNLILWGNFYILKNLDSDGTLTSLWPLNAAYVTRRDRQVVWTFTDPLTGTAGDFTPDLVWRGTILSGTGGLDGTAITLLAREAIGMMLAAEEQGARLFKYGIQTDFALIAKDSIDDKDELRRALMQRHSGSGNAFLPLLLENGLDAKRIGLTAQESQYLESRGFQSQEIFRIFRIPEVLAGTTGKDSKSSTYASAEQFFQSYVKHTLMPWAVRIEQTANRDLLSGSLEKSRYFFKHEFDSLLRGDTTARFASYETAIASGFLQPAEARRKEGWPYAPGLDYFVDQRAGAGGQANAAAGAKPTDESALAERVASHVWEKERKALSKGQDADVFYTHFGGYLEDLTGADADSIRTYLEMRRTTSDRFSGPARVATIETLILLCKKDK